jgi:ABC-type amino acid transport substrate-binding protein
MKKIYLILLLSVVSATAILFAAPTTNSDSYYTIKKRGVLKIGISKNYPPLNFHSGKMGVEIEMAKKLAKFLDNFY